jgi:hypothetical protein
MLRDALGDTDDQGDLGGEGLFDTGSGQWGPEKQVARLAKVCPVPDKGKY